METCMQLKNILVSLAANFVSATMFPRLGRTGKHSQKHVSPTLPSLLRALTSTQG